MKFTNVSKRFGIRSSKRHLTFSQSLARNTFFSISRIMWKSKEFYRKNYNNFYISIIKKKSHTRVCVTLDSTQSARQSERSMEGHSIISILFCRRKSIERHDRRYVRLTCISALRSFISSLLNEYVIISFKMQFIIFWGLQATRMYLCVCVQVECSS